MLAFNRIGCTLSPRSSPSRGRYPRTPKLDMGGQDQGYQKPRKPIDEGNSNFEAASKETEFEALGRG